MDVQITRSNDIFKYSPQVDGYNNGDIFKTISGTPAISSNKLRLNAAEIISMESFRNSNLEINMLIPTAPTLGDSRQFGFKALDDGDLGRCEFDITGTVFSAVLYDASGTLIAQKTINWNSAWTNTAARYRISTSENNVFFAVNDVIIARFERGYDRDIVPTDILSKKPLEIHIDNNNSDNLDITSINLV